MADTDHDRPAAELTAWIRQRAQHLGLPAPDGGDVQALLSASAAASADLVRPAGPVAMYVVGLLVGGGAAHDVDSACRTVDRLLTRPESQPGRSAHDQA